MQRKGEFLINHLAKHAMQIHPDLQGNGEAIAYFYQYRIYDMTDWEFDQIMELHKNQDEEKCQN